MLTACVLNEIAEGDRAAFSRLYSTLRPGLLRYAAALLAGDADAAMDVVGEAFLDIWRHAGGYSGSGSVEGWIRRIVRNKAVDWLRSRRERPVTAFEARFAETLADETDTPARTAELASDAKTLRKAVERLSPDHREAIWLCFFEERSLAEIAEIAGCPENTVKTRLFHARRQLRRDLERLDRVMAPLTGLEPVTPSLRMRCSTS
jgi:RNA polymerase sigma-70 factor, ECF subfamily